MQGLQFTLLNDKEVIIFPDKIIRIWEDEEIIDHSHIKCMKIKDITGEVIAIRESYEQVVDHLCQPRNTVDNHVFGRLIIANGADYSDIDINKWR